MKLNKFLKQCKRFTQHSYLKIKLYILTIRQETIVPPSDLEKIPNHPPIHRVVALGLFILIFFVGGFFVWAIFSTLDTAVIASGKIIVSTNRKAIQHLEGGIIEKIFVQENSVIKENEKLVQLDKTQADIRVQLLNGQYAALKALESRLIAERDQLQQINFPTFLIVDKTDSNIQKQIQIQTEIFNTNRKTLNDNIAILQERIAQLRNEIKSLKSQAESYDTQLNYINEEMQAVIKLEAQKYIDKPKLLALKREAARLTGNRDEQLALAARAEQRIGETQLQMISIKNDFNKQTIKDLEEVQTKINDVEEHLKAAQDILKRTIIFSPIPGKVVNLKIHTVGGVISPGQLIMEIVPNEDVLIAEVRINPIDIDSVRPGLKAEIRLVAYKQRITPIVTGKVLEVSADSLQDEKTNEYYYLARIAIEPKELIPYPHIKLYPGMPVQAMIITQHKTPLNYFIAPIEESFSRAFREE